MQLLSGGQWVISEVIKGLSHQIDFDPPSGLAKRWYPLGTQGLIVLDPAVRFGRPTIIGKGIEALNVYDLFIAEKRNEEAVHSWLNLTHPEVKAAVAFEEKLAA